MTGKTNHRVLIVGGGFAGLRAAQALHRAPVAVTLIDRQNYHLFQPLLYQVATGGLSPADIASPLRGVLRRHRNVEVLQGDVTGFDVPQRRLILENIDLGYDTLVLATGASHCYFGRPDWQSLAPGLKTLEDATEIRRRIFTAFERAERETDPDRQRPWMTFVVVGGGPTGVELAGAIGELAHHTLPKDFHRIDTKLAEVQLIEGNPHVLSGYPETLSQRARKSLERLGVTVRTGCMVSDVQPTGVTIRNGDRTETISSGVVLWAAGVNASPLGAALARSTGTPLDRQGRVVVGPDLTLPEHPEIFVIGDLAHVPQPDGTPLPGIAPVAMQQGEHVARMIRHRLNGRPSTNFRYRDRGKMAVIGRSAAVAHVGRLKMHGLIAWLAWLFIHVFYLVEFQNRLLVTIQWGWNYLTRNRSARLITETARSREYDAPVPLQEQPAPLPKRPDGARTD